LKTLLDKKQRKQVMLDMITELSLMLHDASPYVLPIFQQILLDMLKFDSIDKLKKSLLTIKYNVTESKSVTNKIFWIRAMKIIQNYMVKL